MAEAVKTKRRTRGGHGAYVSQVLPEPEGFIKAGESTTEMRPSIARLETSLEEQLKKFKITGRRNLSGLVEQEGVTDKEISEEVQIAGNLKGEIRAITTTLAELLTPKSESPVSPHPNPPVAGGNMATNNNVRAKLPKLEVRRFNGKVDEWQEFWDCYESSIHSNPNLSDFDKFSYLHGLLGGAARTTIAGLELTAANYEVAIDLLRGRFGKPVVLKRAHGMNCERDTTGLRRLYDTIKIHQRGLKALEVDASMYKRIVVPPILGKLPEAVKLQIT